MLNEFDELKKYVKIIYEKCPKEIGLSDKCYIETQDCITCWYKALTEIDKNYINLGEIK